MDGRRPGLDKELAWWERVSTAMSRCLRATIGGTFGLYEAALMAFLTDGLTAFSD